MSKIRLRVTDNPVKKGTEAQKQYQKRLESGYCVLCGLCPPIEGKTLCAKCAEKKSKELSNHYYKKKAEGKCLGCRRNKPAPESTRCGVCLILEKAAYRKKRAQLSGSDGG